ncbi:MAG: hypothetical protein K0R08_2317 [Solimicrobium sp.]|jgi:hypothetical protein|nr:hypothetical protein [Solimicrobium sp.]
MNMQLLSSNSYPSSSSFQQIEQVENQNLFTLLKQTDKSLLIVKLDSQIFSQETLHSLLYQAFSEEGRDVVADLLRTKSYAPGVVAKIIVDTLENEQGENEQQRFVSELLTDVSSRVTVLATALRMAVERRINLNKDRLVIEKLIRFIVPILCAQEALQVVNACPEICEFLVFEQLARGASYSLSNNQAVIDELEVHPEIGPGAMEKLSFLVTEHSSFFSTILAEIKTLIGQFLTMPDLLQYGQINKGFRQAMEAAIQNYASQIKIPKLTEGAVTTLKKVHCLDLKITNHYDPDVSLISQLTNLHSLDCRKYIRDVLMGPLVKNLINLRNLSICDIYDTGLPYLSELLNLHSLSVRRITDVGLHYLTRFPNLHTLRLNFCEITDRGCNI